MKVTVTDLIFVFKEVRLYSRNGKAVISFRWTYLGCKRNVPHRFLFICIRNQRKGSFEWYGYVQEHFWIIILSAFVIIVGFVCLFVCLFVWGSYVPLEIFSLIWRRQHSGDGLQISTCTRLSASSSSEGSLKRHTYFDMHQQFLKHYCDVIFCSFNTIVSRKAQDSPISYL